MARAPGSLPLSLGGSGTCVDGFGSNSIETPVTAPMTRHESHAGPHAGHTYIPPRHHVLLLSCMDPRLIDDLTAFMHRDNLTNRFDQVILAGAALGVLQTTFPHWRETFFEHVALSVALHNIKDVYIVEHRHCGAYKHFLGKEFDNTPEGQALEEQVHREHAFELKEEILRWSADQKDPSGKPLKLHVYCFLMDLRGHAKLLDEPKPEPKAKPAKATKKRSPRR
jgi:carbonic anhydrase